MKAQIVTKLEFESPQAVERFRKAAKDFTARSTKSQAAARKVLIDEGIYTKSGKLTKQYRSSPALHRLTSTFVLGYHGCDQRVGEQLLSGVAFKPSNNDYDWLGPGIYFWEANPLRGLEFAREVSKRTASKISKPFVIGAVIDVGLCLDLTTSNGLEWVKIAYAGSGANFTRSRMVLR